MCGCRSAQLFVCFTLECGVQRTLGSYVFNGSCTQKLSCTARYRMMVVDVSVRFPCSLLDPFLRPPVLVDVVFHLHPVIDPPTHPPSVSIPLLHSGSGSTMYLPSSCSHPPPAKCLFLKQLINRATEGLELASNGPYYVLWPHNPPPTHQHWTY